MKLTPLLVTGSLLANLGCAVALLVRPALAPTSVQDFMARHFAVGEAGGAVKLQRATTAKATAPAVVPRPVWAALQADDLATFAARLKAAGFPVEVINAMLRAEVAARYGARQRAIIEAPAGEYWKAGVNTLNNPARMEEYNQLQRERSKVLRDLLLDEAGAGDARDLEQRRMFGELPRAKLDRIQRIEDDYAEMNSAVRAAMNGITLSEDREKLALLAREKQSDLAAFLTPEEMAEYSIRNSTIGNMLRTSMTAFEATETEFRTVLAAQQALNEKTPGGVSGTGSMPSAQAQREYEAQMRAGLGDARYAEYQRATNNEFQTLKRLADRENLPPGAATQAFDLRDEVARESTRIFGDATLSHEQKMAALQALAQTTRTQLLSALGPKVGSSYVSTADAAWLANVERGNAVRFDSGSGYSTNPDGSRVFRFGGSPSFRRLPGLAPTTPPGIPVLPRQ